MMRQLLAKLRDRLRGDLPDELIHTRRRFALLATVLMLSVLSFAFWNIHRAMVERQQSSDISLEYATSRMPISLPGLDIMGSLDPERLVRISDDAPESEDVVDGEVLFRVLLYPDGSFLMLDDAFLSAGMDAAEFLREYNDFDRNWEMDEAGGALYLRNPNKSWSYVVNNLYDEQLAALNRGKLLDPWAVAEKDEPVAAKVLTIHDTTRTQELVRSYSRDVTAMWLALVIPVALVCYLLARVAMRPAARAWEQQQRFVLDASHELKTPLASLSANLDALVANGSETVESQRCWTDYLRSDVDALTGLTYRLLDTARAGAGAVEDAEGSCDAVEVARATLGRFEARAAARGLSCSVEAGECPTAACSAAALGDVLSALVDNAVLYADEGGSVSVAVKPLSRRSLAIVVANSGEGIAARDLPHVFERFWRGDAARARGEGEEVRAGYGLGLAIARERARSFGGDITVASEPDVRTVFTVEVPAR